MKDATHYLELYWWVMPGSIAFDALIALLMARWARRKIRGGEKP